MDFPSIPAYLDPTNWQQPQNQQATNAAAGMLASSSSSHLLPPPQPPQAQLQPPELPRQPPHGPGGGSVRPGSMAERARMANIPMPEAALKCPRCESTNTKFCYFNNYSLSQPRHFCKTCRRYWTRGGALRNVPVGGGCRRNKRSKNSSSSSTASATSSSSSKSQDTSANIIDHHRSAPTSSLGPMISSYGMSGLIPPTHHDQILGLGSQLAPLRLVPIGTTDHHFSSDHSAGILNYTGISGPLGQELSGLGGGGSGTNTSLLTGFEQWRFPGQLPLLGGLDPFEGGIETSIYGSGNVRSKIGGAGLVKVEDSVGGTPRQEMSLARQFLGGSTDQSWNTSTHNNATNSSWTDLSNFSSSSTSNPL